MKFLPGLILAVLLVPACHKKITPAAPADPGPSTQVQLAPATLETHQATEEVVGTSTRKVLASRTLSGELE